MIRKGIIFIVLILSLSGCYAYKEFSIESFEKSKPFNRIEFLMKDNTIASFNSKQMEMVRSTPENYTVYLKDGRRINFIKSEIKSVRMTDEKKVKTFLFITDGILVGLTIVFLVILMNAFGS